MCPSTFVTGALLTWLVVVGPGADRCMEDKFLSLEKFDWIDEMLGFGAGRL